MEVSNWKHLSVDVRGTSDIAFHEIWFVLLLHHKQPAIVNLLIRECQSTFFVLRCTAHCSRKMHTSTPINNPYAHAISNTMRKDSRQLKERSTKIWHQHRGPADQALPSTLDDPLPIQWCSQWSSSSSAGVLSNSLLISNSLSIWCLILRASCYDSDFSPQVCGLLSRKRLSSSAKHGTHRHKQPKMTEILNC